MQEAEGWSSRDGLQRRGQMWACVYRGRTGAREQAKTDERRRQRAGGPACVRRRRLVVRTQSPVGPTKLAREIHNSFMEDCAPGSRRIGGDGADH